MSDSPQNWALRAKRLTVAMVATVVGLVVVGAAATTWYHVRNFGVVRQGVLYRSAQPYPRGLTELLERDGIKTIVNLRQSSEEPGTGWYEAEKSWAEHHGVRMIDLPIHSGGIPTNKQVAYFLALCRDPNTHPILLHCQAGKDRTGYLAAIYRMEFDGWPAERAIQEMQQYRFNPDPARHGNELEGLRRYKVTTAPSSQGT
jgi:tyrosine-protein phosphatase SIW14